MRVLHAAEFGALPAIDAGSFRSDAKFVGPAGDEILFAGKARYPERVNDIDAFELEAHVAPDRNMDFVCSLEALLG